MKASIFAAVLDILFKILTPELLKNFVDYVLDWIESYVLGSASTVDDKLVIPLCNLIRTTFGIPDNDLPVDDVKP